MANKIEKAGKKAVHPVEAKLTGANFRAELRKVLGKIPPEHFVRVALTAMQKQPKIMLCSPASVFQALLDCASVGLEPDGRRAHLVPYNTKHGMMCQLIIDYKGYVDLMTRPGKGNEVAFVDAAIVYDSDDFEWNMNAVVRHRYDLKSEKHGKKEEAIAAYVAIHFKNGMVKYELMTKAEILSVKARSKAAGSGPWVTDELEMWKKCPLRRAAKWVPINDQTARALEIDYDRFDTLGDMSGGGPKDDPPDVPLMDGADAGAPWEGDMTEMQKKKETPEGKVLAKKKGMPKPKPGEEEPPEDAFGEGGPGWEEDEEPPTREPGQDNEEEQPAGDARREIMKLLSAKCRGNETMIANHLKRLTSYKTKSGYESKGKDDVEKLTPREADIALAKLREELGFGE